jgi:hypothetical protein
VFFWSLNKLCYILASTGASKVLIDSSGEWFRHPFDDGRGWCSVKGAYESLESVDTLLDVWVLANFFFRAIEIISAAVVLLFSLYWDADNRRLPPGVLEKV